MPAELRQISDPSLQFPEFLILDASIVLELTPNPLNPHRYHDQVRLFFYRISPLAQRGQIMLLLPLLAFEECLYKLCQVNIQTQISNPKDWHIYYKSHPEVILHSKQVINQFYAILKGFPIVIVEPEDVSVFPVDTKPRLADRMVDLIYNYQVLPKDATILSEAERLGIFTVATLDSDWQRANGFTVYTAY